MKDKHILISGGTAGIGKAAAKVLAAMGANVTLLGRDPQRGKAAVAEIREATGNPSVFALSCDLSSRDDVRRAAAEFRKDHSRLDVLINNAGLFLPQRELTQDGLERTFAGIYLGQFQLTELLLDLIKAAPEGRIICVTCPPAQAKINFDDLTFKKGYSTLKAQYQAKGALLMYVMELSRRLKGSNVTVNSMLPGMMIKTDLHQRMPWYFKLTVGLFGITAEEAAKSEVRLAVAPELKGVTGRHFHLMKEKPITGPATDEATCQRMVDVSRKLAHL